MKINKRQVALSLCVSGTLSFAPLPGHAQDTTPVEASNLCRQFHSLNMRDREKIVLQALGPVRQVEKCLLQELDDLLQKPVEELRQFDGPFHNTLLGLAAVRSREAVGRLLPLIDFQLDPATAGAGTSTYGPNSYPVALALSEIGDKHFADALFERLRQPTSDTTLRVITWVLQQDLRREGVHIKVQEQLGAIAEHLKDNPDAVHLKDKIANLKRMQELLASKKPLLIVDPSLKYVPPK